MGRWEVFLIQIHRSLYKLWYIFVLGNYTVFSLITTNSFYHLWWRSQSYDHGIKWIYRRKGYMLRLGWINSLWIFYWRKFWRGDLKLLIMILRFQIKIEGLDLIILGSWLLKIRIIIDSVWYKVTFSIITTVRRTI